MGMALMLMRIAMVASKEFFRQKRTAEQAAAGGHRRAHRYAGLN
jgi:hypothetical protein